MPARQRATPGPGRVELELREHAAAQTRSSSAAGDRLIARTATRASEAEAEAETQPARATAASMQCRGLLESDPVPLREAVEHYRLVGPAGQLPTALEDLAVVLAERGEEDEAGATLNEAVSLYEGLQARWDIGAPKADFGPTA